MQKNCEKKTHIKINNQIGRNKYISDILTHFSVQSFSVRHINTILGFQNHETIYNIYVLKNVTFSHRQSRGDSVTITPKHYSNEHFIPLFKSYFSNCEQNFLFTHFKDSTFSLFFTFSMHLQHFNSFPVSVFH